MAPEQREPEFKDKEADAFEALAGIIEKQNEAELEICEFADSEGFGGANLVKFSQKVMKPVYEERRELIKSVPKFWPTVLDASALLGEYITFEDNMLLDSLTDIYIEWDEDNAKNFMIHFEFEENEFLETLKLSKRFESVKDDDEEHLESTPVPIKWKKGKNLTKHKDGRDTSFFNWFNFLGKGPGDYKGGDSIALILSDELYPHALKFFVDSVNAGDDIEDEYDISSDEEDEADEEDDEADGDDGIEDEAGQEPAAKKPRKE